MSCSLYGQAVELSTFGLPAADPALGLERMTMFLARQCALALHESGDFSHALSVNQDIRDYGFGRCH